MCWLAQPIDVYLECSVSLDVGLVYALRWKGRSWFLIPFLDAEWFGSVSLADKSWRNYVRDSTVVGVVGLALCVCVAYMRVCCCF